MAQTKLPPAKSRIMEAALESFNSDGIRGVSADTIIGRAGVAKMTFYKYFPSKDDLAAAFVHERSNQFIAWLADRVEKRGRGRTPKQRILALFDALDEWFTSDAYFGCPFHRAATEFPDAKNPIHKEVLRNKQRMLEFISGLVKAAKVDDQRKVVKQLVLLMAGAEMSATVDGNAEYVRYAREAARRLLR
jgi:AcrR family transcriptional regulator